MPENINLFEVCGAPLSSLASPLAWYQKGAILILFEKGILATILLLLGFLFNAILQANKMRGETSQLEINKAIAYEKVWKALALIRPADDEAVRPEKRKQVEKIFGDWYHDDSGALYMSWLTARRYMLLRRVLDNEGSSGKIIRKKISLLRTRLKIDCGIYTFFDGLMPLPNRKCANRANAADGKNSAAE